MRLLPKQEAIFYEAEKARKTRLLARALASLR
jgi:hypothetical protein